MLPWKKTRCSYVRNPEQTATFWEFSPAEITDCGTLHIRRIVADHISGCCSYIAAYMRQAVFGSKYVSMQMDICFVSYFYFLYQFFASK
jgi:hypothetical protein